LKYFICALGKTNIGIPARQTQQIISVTNERGASNETENGEVIISLPELFKQKDNAACHGLILKTNNGEPYKVRTVLLTPKIDAELEIPEEDIRGLPKAMAGVYSHFTGAYCDGQNIILILNPEKIIKGVS
jgi:chemotaxis signal transduction protein